jgi:multidrug transporter EmrE-like cation transporter
MAELIEWGYIGVFIASFLAATVLPFSSEVVLTGVLFAGADYWQCMLAATLGNFLGGMSCYYLGMLGKVEWIEKYLKLDIKKLEKVQNWIKGKGSVMAFFVFLPGRLKGVSGWEFYSWLLGFLCCMSLSMYLLIKAIQTIPIGTAYPIWTGIGAAGTVLLGILFFHEPATFWRLFFISTLVISVVGLKMV